VNEINTRKSFSLIKSIAVLIGIVVGTGIFSFPPLIAQNVNSPLIFILIWLLGGFVSFMGAICYAALASRYPDSGGEYSYLKKAYGDSISFLFAWARMTIIQTGSIAIIAFIFGDYATAIFNLGPHSASIYAFVVIIVFTFINSWGTKYAQFAQIALTTVIIILILLLSVMAFYQHPIVISDYSLNQNSIISFNNNFTGTALIFVLLTFGGWNETSYLAGEMKSIHKNMIKTLGYGLLIITFLYVLLNFAFIQVLGFEGLKLSSAVGYDMAFKLLGPFGSIIVSFLIIICTISTLNASILTGARTNYQLGKEYQVFNFMGQWNDKTNSPIQALIVQCIISLALVGLGFYSQEKIRSIVDFTAPVFWFFLILITLSIFIYRYRHQPNAQLFKIPFFPLPPLLFLTACVYLLYASIKFTGIYALYGIGVLLAGIPFWLWIHRSSIVKPPR